VKYLEYDWLISIPAQEKPRKSPGKAQEKLRRSSGEAQKNIRKTSEESQG
jgi:hypothetical protein